MFNIEWKENAIRDLNKLNKIIAKRIFTKVSELKTNPYSKNIKRLRGENSFRLRIGDYRVLFEIDKEIITILKIGHRKNIYKK